MSASSDNLRVKYPEFADTTEWADATIDIFLGWAAAELDAETWGCHFEAGSYALAAHMMAIAKRSKAAQGSSIGGASGGISSLKTGDEQISYFAPSMPSSSTADDTALGSTMYGLEYLRLRERVVAGPLYVC